MRETGAMSLVAARSRRLVPSRLRTVQRGGAVLLGTVILTAASTVVAGSAGAVSGNAGGRVRLAGSVPALPVGAQVVGPSSATTEVQADVSLETRRPAPAAT